MAKSTDLEGRFDKAMKKGEKQDKVKRSTSDGYMTRKESVIERSNRQVAERNKGKTKEQISNDAFKAGRTSGRY